MNIDNGVEQGVMHASTSAEYRGFQQWLGYRKFKTAEQEPDVL